MKCDGCGKAGFKSAYALSGHQRWCVKWPGSPRYEGAKDAPLGAAASHPQPEMPAAPIPGTESETGEGTIASGSGTEPFYPPLQGFEESAAIEGEGAPAEAEAAPGAKPEAIFDTTGLWKSLGQFIDDSLLKEKKGKVNITDAKAALLDGSLKQLGIAVEAPPVPIVIGYWVPFAMTLLSVIVLPIVLAYVPDLLKNVKMPWSKKKEEDSVETEAPEE